MSKRYFPPLRAFIPHNGFYAQDGTTRIVGMELTKEVVDVRNLSDILW